MISGQDGMKAAAITPAATFRLPSFVELSFLRDGEMPGCTDS